MHKYDARVFMISGLLLPVHFDHYSCFMHALWNINYRIECMHFNLMYDDAIQALREKYALYSVGCHAHCAKY